MERLKEIKMWEASDGKQFEYELEATQHQKAIDMTPQINAFADNYCANHKYSPRRWHQVVGALTAYHMWLVGGQKEAEKEVK